MSCHIYTLSWLQFYCMLKCIIKGSKTWQENIEKHAEIINTQNTTKSHLPLFNKNFYFIWSKCYCLKKKQKQNPEKYTRPLKSLSTSYIHTPVPFTTFLKLCMSAFPALICWTVIRIIFIKFNQAYYGRRNANRAVCGTEKK